MLLCFILKVPEVTIQSYPCSHPISEKNKSSSYSILISPSSTSLAGMFYRPYTPLLIARLW